MAKQLSNTANKLIEKSYAKILEKEFGYKKKGYGYYKETESITHWVTIFDDYKVQLYGYATLAGGQFNPLDENIYSTGIIEIKSVDLLKQLASLFIKNHR